MKTMKPLWKIWKIQALVEAIRYGLEGSARKLGDFAAQTRNIRALM